MKHELELSIQPQPSDSSCGPTCLHSVYRYWGEDVGLPELIAEIQQFATGGTLAVQLACHALRRGYDATIYTYNLHLFDPVWFNRPGIDLAEKLQAQQKKKWGQSERLMIATEHYLQFLQLGGRVLMQPLEADLVVNSLTAGVPVLAGLSATFLYQEARERSQVPDERGVTSLPDDEAGTPVGHFVVLCGYDQATRMIRIADPLLTNSRYKASDYMAPLDHVSAAIFLGVITYDANLLMIQPRIEHAAGKVQDNQNV